MSQKNTITIDMNLDEVLANLDVAINVALKPFLRGAARVSADHLRGEMQARLSRQLSGTSTGFTASSIKVSPDRTGWGWVVQSGNVRTPMLPWWLERGTRKMAARAYFDHSILLEDSPHRRRMELAINACLSQYGLAQGQGR